jgi:hypothetical protein
MSVTQRLTLEQIAALIALDAAGGEGVVFEHLQVVELVRMRGDTWEVTERGRAFLDHLERLPLPVPITQWLMPSADPAFDLAAFGSAVHLRPSESAPPPPPLRPKRAIPTDPDELKAEALRLMDAGYGMNEVKEQLELTAAQAQQFFFGH